MKNFFFAASFIMFLAACSDSFDEGNTDTALDGPEPSREWQLVWEDEFDGNALDTSKWNYQIGDGKAYVMAGWGNNEEQYYTDSPDNVRVEDGNLIISALSDGVPMSEVDPTYGNTNKNYDYTSARINTSEKFEFTYGRVEARIKMQSSSGLWHAFWLLGSESSPYGGWPQKGEIDVMEAWVHNRPVIGSAAHFGTSGVHQYKSKDFEVDFDDGEYHTYAVEWDSEQIRWFVDGEHFYTLTRDSYWNYYEDEINGWQGFVDKNADEEDDNLSANLYADYQNTSINAPFDKDQYIILNTAVNGNLPASAGEFADPDGPVSLGEMHVDYVKVWQCPEDPLLPAGTGCKQSLDTFKEEPYYSNPSFRPEYPAEQSSFSIMTDLYVDGDLPESIIGVPYDFQTSETLTLTIEDKLEAGRSGQVLSIDSQGRLNNVTPRLSITRGDLGNIILAGFGWPSAQGDFKFDLYVESYPENSNPKMAVGMQDSIQTKGKFTVLSLEDYTVGEWHRVTIPIQNILDGSGDTNINLQKLEDLLFFQFNTEANVKIDNIQFACGGIVCGIIDRVPVFIDSVDQLWTRGIRGNDAQQKSTLFENPDYTENDQHHVQWEIFDTGEEGHDFVIETTIGTARSDTDPLYPSEAVNFIGSENAISAIAALSEGEFRFDLRMMHNPNDVALYFKVDGAGSSTGEQTLGDLPIGVWQTFACPISSLRQQGLDVATITAPFVMVPGENGSGKDLRFQWDNVVFSPYIEDENNVKVLTLPITFDQGGFCLPIAPFSGGAFQLSNNPVPVGHTDNEVGKTVKYDYGITWGGITLNLEPDGENGNIVFSDVSSQVGKRFTMKVLSPRDPNSLYANPTAAEGEVAEPIGPMTITFKLEAVPGEGVDVERTFTLTKVNEWEEAVFDFTGTGVSQYEGITLIIDDGYRSDNVTDNWTLYFDEVERSDSTATAANLADRQDGSPVIYDFDQVNEFIYPAPTGYQGARGAVTTDPDGTAGNVAKVLYDVNEGGPNNRGVTLVGSGEGFSTPIPFDVVGGRTTISIRVNTPEANTPVLLKVEDAQDANRFAELTQTTTQAGWQILTFDFSMIQNETFEKLGIIFDPTACIYNAQLDPDCSTLPRVQEYYFDDIQLLQ